MAEEFKRKLSEMEDIDETLFSNKPWVQQLLNSCMATTKKAVLNWCNVVIKIGEKEVELNEYTSIFFNQTESLYEELLTDIEAIHDKSLEKIERLLQEMQDLCKDLRIEIPQFKYENLSLGELQRQIQLKINEFRALADIRLKEIRDINNKIIKLSTRLGREPRLVLESPLPLLKEVDEARVKMEILETVAMEKEEQFFQLKEEIIVMVEELGMAPMLDFEKEILNLTNREVRISGGEMEELEAYHGRLKFKLNSTKEEIAELRMKVEELWNKLEMDMAERDCFREKFTGNSLQTLEALQNEMKKLEEIKKANIRGFIERQREELEQWWQKCHCTESDKRFTYFYSQCYNEDLFELHERELEKWKNYYEENKEIFQTLEEHKQLWNEHMELELNSGGRNRYKNRGGQLLIEEKKRNRFKKRIPKLEEQLLGLASAFEMRCGREFQTFGQSIENYVKSLHEDEDKQFKLKLSAKKQQRVQQTTAIGGSRMNLFPPSAGSMLNPSLTPIRMAGTIKRKIFATPQTEPVKKRKSLGKGKVVVKTGLPKLNISKEKRKRRSAKIEKLRQKLVFKKGGKENVVEEGSGEQAYNEFVKEVSQGPNSRSTAFVLKENNNGNKGDLLTDLN